MDKATRIITEAVQFDAMAFGQELHRQRIESERDAESSGNLMARRAARARAHTLAQMSLMKTARELAGNMGTMILALGIAGKVLGIPASEQAAAAEDWQASLASL